MGLSDRSGTSEAPVKLEGAGAENRNRVVTKWNLVGQSPACSCFRCDRQSLCTIFGESHRVVSGRNVKTQYLTEKKHCVKFNKQTNIKNKNKLKKENRPGDLTTFQL